MNENKSQILEKIKQEVRQKIEGETRPSEMNQENVTPEDKLIYIRY